MSKIWLDKVSIDCKKCDKGTKFYAMVSPLSASDSVTYEEIFDAVAETTLGIGYNDFDQDNPKFKHGGNCEEGYLNTDNRTFICKDCLMKALKKKRQRAREKKNNSH